MKSGIKLKILRYAAAAALVVLCAAGLIYLYMVEPGTTGVPGFECTFQKITGLYCPSCGMSRQIHFLLHGKFALAFSYNQIGIVIITFLGFALFYLFRWLITGKEPPAIPLWLVILLVVILIVYGVLRNLPMEPFQYLAPPE